jgi:membrane-associated protein
MGPVGGSRDARRVDLNWLHDLFATLDAIPTWQLYAIVGALLVLETTVLVGLVIPGEVALLAAATTVGDAGEYFALAAVAAVASLVGQSGGYLIGRRFGPRLRASWAGRKIGEPHWQRAERVLRGGAGRAIVGSRFLAVAHSLVPVIAGTLRMPLRRFAPWTALGVVVWGLVYVGLGSAASAAVRGSAHLIGPTFTAVVVAAVLAALVVRAVRAKRRERAAAARVPTGV